MKKIIIVTFLFVLIQIPTFAQQVFLPEIISVTAKNGETYEVVSIIGPKNFYQTLVEKIEWEKWQAEREKHNFTDTENFYHQLPHLVSKERNGLSELNRIKHNVLGSLLDYGLGDVEDMTKISYFAEELLAHKYLFTTDLNENSGQTRWLKNGLTRLKGYWSDERLQEYKKDYLAFYEPFIMFNVNYTPTPLDENATDEEKKLDMLIKQSREQQKQNFLNLLNIFKKL